MSELRAATPDDAGAICAIYNPYVATTTITFEEAPVTETAMATRIGELLPTHPWWVSVVGGAITGYAYAAPWRTRSAYRYSVETTVYVAPGACGCGVGTQLYRALLDDLSQRRFHCAMGGIALPNAASVALHEKMGFAKVAHFRQVGAKFGRWIDVGYWQRQLLDQRGLDSA